MEFADMAFRERTAASLLDRDSIEPHSSWLVKERSLVIQIGQGKRFPSTLLLLHMMQKIETKTFEVEEADHYHISERFQKAPGQRKSASREIGTASSPEVMKIMLLEQQVNEDKDLRVPKLYVKILSLQ